MKSFLLDTHALLWMGGESAMLRPDARDELAQGLRFVSVVSIAEIAIKAALGKLSLPPPFHTDFEAAIRTLLEESVIDLLSLDLRTLARLRHLPQYHKDPFDRMIIAQALDRGLTVATRDRAFSAYAGLDILEV